VVHGDPAPVDMSEHGLVATTMPDLFRLAMRQSPVATCLVGLDGHFLAVNPAARDLFRHTADDLVQVSLQRLVHPDDVVADTEGRERIARGESDSYRVLQRFARPDGSTFLGDLTVSTLKDSDDAVLAYVVQIVDVTERQEAREEAAAAREEMRGVIDSLLDPWVYLVAVRDADGRIVDFAYRDANEAALAANRMGRDELLSRTLLELLPTHAENGLFEQYVDVVETGVPLALDDDPYANELTGTDLRWFDNRAVKVGDGLSFTWRDVTDRVRIRRRLAHEARSDSLTGLANRLGLKQAARAMFGREPRNGKRLAILYCDLDDMKQINDTYGHACGDLVLRAVADRIDGALRHGDIAARVGGDEFVILADGVTDDEAALALVVRIAEAVTRPVAYGPDSIVPTLSVGLALADPGDDVDASLARADAALYERKRERREAEGG
jgi:diguanylate cyclase (GGDEF)-like protein/PAS domain S-box-containing protein